MESQSCSHQHQSHFIMGWSPETPHGPDEAGNGCCPGEAQNTWTLTVMRSPEVNYCLFRTLNAFMKSPSDKETRLATTMAGRADWKEFVRKKTKINPFFSSTNKEKKRKILMMIRYSPNVQSKTAWLLPEEAGCTARCTSEKEEKNEVTYQQVIHFLPDAVCTSMLKLSEYLLTLKSQGTLYFVNNSNIGSNLVFLIGRWGWWECEM